MTTQYINIPAKVISAGINSLTGYAYWPYNNGNDPYWQHGATPKFYQWDLSLTVAQQVHSSPYTRAPFIFNGMDVEIGDYVADVVTGTAVKIVSINSKTSTNVDCIVEDVFRYNTFRDPTGQGNGIFTNSNPVVIFEVNEEGQPVTDPTSVAELSGFFYNNLSSRFQNLEQNYNFILEKTNHGFTQNDLIAVDQANATFTLASPNFPYLVGTVSNLDLGPNAFAVNPFEKVTDNYNFLLGNVGSVIFADDNNPGGLALSGSHPVMIKLVNQSNSYVQGTIAASNTTPGDIFTLNGETITVSNTGSIADFISDINFYSAQTGVLASSVQAETVAQPTTNPSGFIQVPAIASINGIDVTFTTTTNGQIAFGIPGYADMVDATTDINAANIPNITASVFNGAFGSNILQITDSAAGSITIVNVSNDQSGNPFAGPNSSTGLPLFTPASTSSYVILNAVDARPINLNDVSGSPTADFGLFSVENGTKAAAISIDRGIRQADTYVVANLAGLNALNALVGDSCFVQNIGDGTWAYYLYSMNNTWIEVSNQPSSETDAQTIEVFITPTSNANAVIHTITNGRRVSFVTVTVNTPFDSDPSITVGDVSVVDRLMTATQNDLTESGVYSTTPSYVYETGTDTNIMYYFDANSSTVGNAIVAITYI